MNKPTYNVEIDSENSFSFLSVGKNGIILKIVEFAEIGEDILNLGFGDYNFTTGNVDDKVNSENGDAEKVLATIYGILVQFLARNNYKSVYISGSTPIRKRLYQMIINNYYDEFCQTFEIMGRVDNQFVPFEKNKNYSAFLVKYLLK